MTSSSLAKKMESFECMRCNECCKQPGDVYVSMGEADECGQYLKLSPYDFVNRYCDLKDRQKLVLKKKEDDSCIFLSESGCAVHPVKPNQCVEFPFKWRTPRSFDYCEGMKKIGVRPSDE